MVVLAFLRLQTVGYAQFGVQPVSTAPPNTSYPGLNGTTISFSFSQAFSSNWYFGGDENSLAIRLSTQSRDERHIGPLLFRNLLQFSLGANYQDDSIPSHTIRVRENEFAGEILAAYPVSWKLDPYIALSLRTPVTETFYYFGAIRTRNQSLWDPVTSRQSTGFTFGTYGTAGTFNTRLGLALQQVRAKYHTQYTDDFKTPERETYLSQSGMEFVNDAYLRGDSTLTYRGRFTLFTSFEELDVWTVRWENETRFRLWKSIGITWIFNVAHNTRETRRTQIRHSLMLGLEEEF